MRARKLTFMAVGVATVALIASACSGTTRNDSTATGGAAPSDTAAANPNATIKTGLKIAYLPKQLNNPYSDIEVSGGKKAVDALKGVYKLVGPNEASASSQVSYINTLVQQQQDAIVIAANDPNAVCPALNQARAGGTKVVTFDSDASPSCRDLFVNQATTAGVGESLAKMTSEVTGGTGDIAILSATPNATNQNAWIQVFKQELAKPQYAGLKLVTTVYGNDDDQKSFQETQGLLQAYPNLKAIVSPTTVGISAASRYVSTSSYKGKVAITGLGTPNQMKQFVKDGTVKEFALWDPAKLGELTGYAAAALVSGQITGKQGEKFTAGELGPYTIGAQGEIVLGPPTVFTSANIDQYNF
ncbi:MAG: rhaS [Amycolatopsis sp.]|uniref:rhamnose ABC transporter substrate-binding protein n=1 Tax=Amycolatopsis sp. TaxID=37632 RepID=UPI002614C331|nr:rhamnose ABC transporter substrate-binding protein [Amycolatopsis sp.]MCU1686391.1 rhaS [Amycolatopsis sp.]